MRSEEYRQAVRMIARSIAFLRAKLVLIDLTALVSISEIDQEWTANFLKNALSKSSIRKSARVFSASGSQPETMQQVMNKTSTLPYDIGLFHDTEKAKAWLLDGYPARLFDEGRITIPLNFNLKLLNQDILNKRAQQRAQHLDENPQVIYAASALPDNFHLGTDFVFISLSQAENLMRIIWKKPPISRQYRFGMLKAARALIEHKLERVLLNNQRLGILTLEDQGWLVSKSLQLLPRTKLRKLAVVTSADSLQQMSSEVIGCKLREANLPYDTRYFLSEEEATEWLMEESA
ncbi:hypothetical protein H9Q13_04380 [Pontibacter sp. JH31]|uniref:STAS/SEC14 domain-containing protein n=1 Tax=Pontibacter aquaedesilientis TaxID=2766980 RepID=A0ABR7XEQ3_9BACT|nr:hypothetical protein [Pontibacter aquaedesilientis]MBD1396391.1 hypothetical protein [Pontibacter aquaedesilientis]